MEIRGLSASVNNEVNNAKEQAAPTQPKIRVRPPPTTYRANLQKLSGTISSSMSEILERYGKMEPSLTLNLYAKHWKFDNQDGVFLYNSPARHILEAIRNEQIPADCIEVFRDVKVRYYEGCLILRIVDHRQEPPNIMHTVLRPTPETIWTELLLYSEQTSGNFTDVKALQVEADILVATTAPLDLRPAINPAHSAILLNGMKDPALPRLKRKRESIHEDDEEERLVYLYDERHGREFVPDFKRLAFVEAHRKKQQLQQQRSAQANGGEKAATAQARSSVSESPNLAKAAIPQGSPALAQAAAAVSGTGGQMPQRTPVPAHLQVRPSASPQPVARQMMNQQALAAHLAQQGQLQSANGNASSPHLSEHNMGSPLSEAMAHQQRVMMHQRAVAIRNLNASRQSQTQAQGQSPRIMNGQLQSPLMGIQGTPTPQQMQQMRQMHQLQAAAQQAAQNAQYQQMR